ncbi:hypothetical protein CSUI_004376 [Cystoisospora suis]|uniref:Uncharacterized protein n=1 Tax=Cystoisospora suis TaxID=483139 RepID=A0A2C6L154_9APIC|nr:hypothetical protein CSUI_004376 [Cystoisospora suis]
MVRAICGFFNTITSALGGCQNDLGRARGTLLSSGDELEKSTPKHKSPQNAINKRADRNTGNSSIIASALSTSYVMD